MQFTGSKVYLKHTRNKFKYVQWKATAVLQYMRARSLYELIDNFIKYEIERWEWNNTQNTRDCFSEDSELLSLETYIALHLDTTSG